MADRAKFLDFLDMIDGGGAGQRGDQFEGGGIFSMLANLMPINPYGSEDPTRRRARDAFYGGLLGDSPDTISAAEAAATPSVVLNNSGHVCSYLCLMRQRHFHRMV